MPASLSFSRSTLSLAVAGLALGGAFVGGATQAPQASAADHRLLPPAHACGGKGDNRALPARAQEKVMRCLINRARANAGRSRLATHPGLTRAARAKNAAMVRHQQFSHTPTGRSFGSIVRRSYNGRSMGENIAMGTGALGSPRSILDGWLKSPGHRRNLLRADWQHQGVALRKNARLDGHLGVAVWSSEFGRR
ncbi:MAG: CAP domain-containing protein [Miltoncostaeaceae bacterium]